MFIPITNTPRAYAWGSVSAMATLFGREPSGRPEAELWFGAHPGSPAVLGGADAPAETLADWVKADPRAVLGDRDVFPFLLKVLAAESSLSLQAHPTPDQAAEGFARENAAGIPLDAPERNYKDPFAKPELIYALSDSFDALCGFRGLNDTQQLFRKLGVASLVPQWDSVQEVFAWLLSGETRVGELVAQLSDTVGRSEAISAGDPEMERAIDTVNLLSTAFPGDPGIAGALMLHRVRLNRGEALFLPAGNIHAYLHGVGIELMGASDNVLRGGLTPKHIDVPELLEVLDFTPRAVPYLSATPRGNDAEVFHPQGCDFQLLHVTGDAQWPLEGPAIAICTAGAFTVDKASTVRLGRGDAVYVTPDEGELHFRGTGELFLATTGN
jgi:mannose-6-phosphate isomerase